jgi:hypothetical protein
MVRIPCALRFILMASWCSFLAGQMPVYPLLSQPESHLASADKGSYVSELWGIQEKGYPESASA